MAYYKNLHNYICLSQLNYMLSLNIYKNYSHKELFIKVNICIWKGIETTRKCHELYYIVIGVIIIVL